MLCIYLHHQQSHKRTSDAKLGYANLNIRRAQCILDYYLLYCCVRVHAKVYSKKSLFLGNMFLIQRESEHYIT